MKPFGFFASVLIFALGVSVEAAGPYYIDYASGNDANNGTSPTTPFQRHPYMTGFSGSYTHTAGDQCYFKGGVTWPNTCFPLVTGQGGTSGALDYYGTNSTYFSGATFIKPVFDCAGTPLDTMMDSTMVTMAYANWVMDSIVVTNLNWQKNGATGNGCYGIFSDGTGYLTNMEFRNWYPIGGAVTSNMDSLQIVGGSPGPSRTSHCIWSGLPSNSHTAKCGFGTTSDNCEYCFAVSAIIGECQYCSNFFIHDLEESIDGNDQHSAAIYQFLLPDVQNYVHDGIISNCSWGELLYPSTIVVDSGHTTTGNFYNILVCNNSTETGPDMFCAPELDEFSGLGGTRGKLNIYNNTFQSSIDNGYIFIEHRTGSDWAVVNETNNQFISEVNYGLKLDTGVAGTFNPGNDLTNSNTQANSAGYTPANSYAPTSLSAPTVGTGFNLSSLGLFSSSLNDVSRGVFWDIGAYQFSRLPIIANFVPWNGGCSWMRKSIHQKSNKPISR